MFFKSYRLCKLFAIAATVVFLPLSTNAQSVDYGGYRPHYQGYGVNTPGGRGGAVCRVTSTSDAAWPPVPGTLRYCVESSSGPRVVIFETSGTIRLVNGELTVRNPYVTIAGQTAPSPGIVIRGQAIIVDTHDVVIQHVRVRVGAVAWEPHGLWIRDGAHNVVIDHVSLSWAVWTNVGIVPSQLGGYRGEVSILDSIVSESLACSGVNSLVPCNPASYPGSGFSNSRAMLIRESGGVSLLRNIFAHNNDRNPETGGPTRDDSCQQHDLQPVADAHVRRVVLKSASWRPHAVCATGQRPGRRTDNSGEQRVRSSRVSRRRGSDVGARRPHATPPVRHLPRWKLLCQALRRRKRMPGESCCAVEAGVGRCGRKHPRLDAALGARQSAAVVRAAGFAGGGRT